MAVSCPEVMYGAYYPYLYGRGAARSFHHAPHFQYDRLNVQAPGNAGAEYGGGGSALSGASGSSSGAQSPGSPPHAHLAHAHAHAHAARLRAKEEDVSAHGRASAASSESEGSCGGGGGGGRGGARAQYVSANCVVFTHYAGDVAAVVDEHFARALALDKHKEGVPMSSRNLPASFFNAAAAAAPACAGLDLYDYDPWHQHYAGYGHAAHRHAAEYHAAAAHHNMAAAGYGGLLLGRGSLHAQYKPVEWGAHHAAHAHAHHAHAHPAAHLDPAACSPYSYPAPPVLQIEHLILPDTPEVSAATIETRTQSLNESLAGRDDILSTTLRLSDSRLTDYSSVATSQGLEAQVQDTSKDLYWF